MFLFKICLQYWNLIRKCRTVLMADEFCQQVIWEPSTVGKLFTFFISSNAVLSVYISGQSLLCCWTTDNDTQHCWRKHHLINPTPWRQQQQPNRSWGDSRWRRNSQQHPRHYLFRLTNFKHFFFFNQCATTGGVWLEEERVEQQSYCNQRLKQ